MQNYRSVIFIFFISVFTSSCLKQTESISPIADIRTLAQLQREAMMTTALKAAGNNELSTDAKSSLEENPGDPSLFYLNLKYNIINMDVYDTANIPNSFEKVGNSILKVFAKVFLQVAGSRTIKIGKIDLNIADLNLDFGIVKSFKVKKVFFEFNKDYDNSTGNIANFSFVNTFSLSRVSGANPLLIIYNKTKNYCKQKCLSFDIIDGDIFDLIKLGNSIPLKPALTIGSLPSVEELKLDGQIDLQIGLKLPF